jgi:hypothetical protein
VLPKFSLLDDSSLAATRLRRRGDTSIREVRLMLRRSERHIGMEVTIVTVHLSLSLPSGDHSPTLNSASFLLSLLISSTASFSLLGGHLRTCSSFGFSESPILLQQGSDFVRRQLRGGRGFHFGDFVLDPCEVGFLGGGGGGVGCEQNRKKKKKKKKNVRR